jgi:CheY-like chemotaxis protein
MATILVVDDEPENLELMEGVLGPTGHTIRTAGGGREALKAVENDLPDLILLDLMMPGVSGFEVCEMLRADPRTARVPIIMVTGLAQFGSKERALALGAEDYLTKPIQPADVLEAVAVAWVGLATYAVQELIGVWPEGGQYALLFGFWAGVTEVIPYIGPWIGAVPPVIAAFFHSPVAALWVIIVFFVIQQLESHILAPNIVGSSVGVHPLVVIFALLAGAQIGGVLGMIASLPLLAMLRHTLTFYDFRMSRAPWAGDDGIALIPARSGAPPPRRVTPDTPVEPPGE